MLKLLEEKRQQLENDLANVPNHEEEISEMVRNYEANIREDFALKDQEMRTRLTSQIEVIDELIEENKNIACNESEYNFEDIPQEVN